MLKILVADDEPLARESIVALLNKEDETHEIFQAKDGQEALELAWQERPQVLFLDIQMPGATGVEVAAELPPETVVIFTTAYDEYAVKAFELNAIDYLLKPFKNIRLYEALDKAKRLLEEQSFLDQRNISALHSELKKESTDYKERIVIREPKRVRFVEVSNVKYISGAGNYAELHLQDTGSILYRETLSNLEAYLDPREFRRIHRSTIVRLSSVAELQPNYQGDYTVVLTTGEQLMLSRRYKDKLQDILT
ncbi:LytR/AlgR family response regulator transcription factor [Planctobacterium marinum]|uniref:DNA-binding response regulator n=1 Tax=Planctobacterium marinum TaxID=1631968 RepID=A0AA48KPF6_9ALTE|nr:DNA-binding response regulator [Planctobacterium marinum]